MRAIIGGLLATLLCPAFGGSQVRIPNRPSEPLFKGSQGKQRTEIHYDPATKTVTVKLVVQDANGYFIQNIRRENFAVYEDGVRQNNATVTVEHAPVSLALLLEYGGRNPSLNRELADEVSRCARQMLETLGKEDAAAIWTYADSVSELAGFTRDMPSLQSVILNLKPPETSETNLYDALIFAINHLRPVEGRKALLLISSGVDTFSTAKFDDVLKAARQSDAPIYVINLAPSLTDAARLHGITAVPIDRNAAEKALGAIARQSGGRLYSPENTIDLSGIYGDMIENLKLRYVITYQSTSSRDPSLPRTVHIELVEAGTGKPLRVLDAAGRSIRPNVIAEGSYTPAQSIRTSAR
jgi:Ca-activated chloride channel family protein